MSQYTQLADKLQMLTIRNYQDFHAACDQAAAILRSLDAQPVAPIDMVLFCPACKMQHIDAPDVVDQYPTPEKDAAHWSNPPHRSHLCHGCGHIWRPANVPTNGVRAVKKTGKADSPIAAPVAAQPPFEKDSWQHAVDDQLVSFGRTSQEFGSPHEAVRWLIEQEVQAAQPTELEELRKQKDGAYFERNQVVAALAKCFPSGVAKTAIEGWSEDWHGCVYIDLPTGQVSWHFHDSQAYLFKDLPPYAGKWDGHDTPEKYRRVNALAAQPQQAKPLSDEEIAFCIFESKLKNPAITRDGTTSIRIARAAIAAFCQKNGIKEQG